MKFAILQFVLVCCLLVGCTSPAPAPQPGPPVPDGFSIVFTNPPPDQLTQNLNAVGATGPDVSVTDSGTNYTFHVLAQDPGNYAQEAALESALRAGARFFSK